MQTEIAERNKFIEIGRSGENLARRVEFDVSEWRAQYGEGTVGLLAQRSGDAAPYPCTLHAENGKYYWYVTATDTAKGGYGSCELQYHVGETVVKSDRWTVHTAHTLGESEEIPEAQPNWVTDVMNAGMQVQTAQAAWENMSAEAETLSAGENATASYADGTLTLGIPRGMQGAAGAAATVQIGTVTRGETASVTNSGTDSAAVLNFVLPKGDKGDKPVKGVDYFTSEEMQQVAALVDAQSVVDNGAYTGEDLAVKFAGEIAAAPYFGDAWAWIRGRIAAKNYKGLHLRDYITVTCTDGTVIRPQIMGINTYKGSGITAQGDHIDFITKDCWPESVEFNLVDFNNGLGCDRFSGSGLQTVFRLRHRTANTYPSLSRVTVNDLLVPAANYSYDVSTGTLTFLSPPAFGDIVKAIWEKPISVPFLASNAAAFLMSDRRGVANDTSAEPTLTEVDYTDGGVWKYLPDNLKAVISDKRIATGMRYTLGARSLSDNDWMTVNLGKLWLPDECEVYGCQKFEHPFSSVSARQYPGFADGNRTKGAGNGGGRTSWWLLPARSGDPGSCCCVFNSGSAYFSAATSREFRVPICFRIA